MNIPDIVRSVVARVTPMRGTASGAIRLGKLIIGGVGMSESIVPRPRAETAASAATKALVHRQSRSPAMSAPVGDPRAVEAVSPATTTERANPLRSAGTIMVAAPVAVGANIAAPIPAKMRVTSAIANVGEAAVARLATMNSTRPANSSDLRGTPAASAAIVGASSAYVIA